MVSNQLPPGLDESEKRAILRRMLETRALGDAVDASDVRAYSQWAPDLLLDDSIQPNASSPMVKKPSAIFLTGATGYLGAFVLHALAQKTDAPLHCLVRAPDKPRGLQRIKAKLEQYLLWDESLRNRIVPVPGDLQKPSLGLSPESFATLAASVDVIFHVGAMVNFLFTYSDMRDANVAGTKEILRLSALHHQKPIHFASTFGIYLTTDFTAKTVTEADLPPVPPEGGYAESKWVAERVVVRARARGFPISVYRPPFIGWHMKSGVFNNKDFVCRLIAGSIGMRSAPDIPLRFHITPVDVVTEAMATVGLKPIEGTGKNYLLVFGDGFAWKSLVQAMGEEGLPLSFAPWEAWRMGIRLSADDNPIRTLLPALPEKLGVGPQTYADILQETRIPAAFSTPNADVAIPDAARSTRALGARDLMRPMLARVSAGDGNRSRTSGT